MEVLYFMRNQLNFFPYMSSVQLTQYTADDSMFLTQSQKSHKYKMLTEYIKKHFTFQAFEPERFGN